jgi:hypothetical protein
MTPFKRNVLVLQAVRVQNRDATRRIARSNECCRDRGNGGEHVGKFAGEPVCEQAPVGDPGGVDARSIHVMVYGEVLEEIAYKAQIVHPQTLSASAALAGVEGATDTAWVNGNETLPLREVVETGHFGDPVRGLEAAVEDEHNRQRKAGVSGNVQAVEAGAPSGEEPSFDHTGVVGITRGPPGTDETVRRPPGTPTQPTPRRQEGLSRGVRARKVDRRWPRVIHFIPPVLWRDFHKMDNEGKRQEVVQERSVTRPGQESQARQTGGRDRQLGG